MRFRLHCRWYSFSSSSKQLARLFSVKTSAMALLLFSTMYLLPLVCADEQQQMKICHHSCLKVCEEARDSSFGERNGHYPDPKLVDTTSDCMIMCKVTEELVSRKSPFAPKVAAICSEVCNRCADACEAANREELSTCINDCRTCAQVCKSYSVDSAQQK